jgi:hypothetical protein
MLPSTSRFGLGDGMICAECEVRRRVRDHVRTGGWLKIKRSNANVRQIRHEKASRPLSPLPLSHPAAISMVRLQSHRRTPHQAQRRQFRCNQRTMRVIDASLAGDRLDRRAHALPRMTTHRPLAA